MVGVHFAESVKYLLLLGNEVSAMKLGLENIRKLLNALGNPQNNYLKVQVAGTNGKGSVCVFLNSICVGAGIKTGLYTSPHLISITERIKINGHDISEDNLALYATKVRETAEKLVADGEMEGVSTFFEQVTAIALLAFAEAGVELAILETGLGGRLDATTAANAEIAAITSIAIDHQEYLGETLAEIAVEKAAVIHNGSIVVIAEQDAEVMNILRERCSVADVLPQFAESIRTKGGKGWLTFRTEKTEYKFKKLGLRGRHQIENAKVAVLLAENLQRYFSFAKSKIIYGLQNARHPGRLDYHGQYLFDGAHNVAGARALRAFLDKNIHQRITMIFGAMRGKNVAEMIEILLPKVENLILTRPSNERALTTRELTEFIDCDFNGEHMLLTDTVAEAIEKANEIVGKNGIILVTGSLYLVGEVKKLLKDNLEFEISNLESKIDVCTN